MHTLSATCYDLFAFQFTAQLLQCQSIEAQSQQTSISSSDIGRTGD